MGGLARALQVTLRLQVQGTDQIRQCYQAKETSSQEPGSTGAEGGGFGSEELLLCSWKRLSTCKTHSNTVTWVTVTRPAPPLEGLSCGQAAVSQRSRVTLPCGLMCGQGQETPLPVSVSLPGMSSHITLGPGCRLTLDLPHLV